MVRSLAFHQNGPGSTPRGDAICEVSLLFVLVLAPRFFLRVLQFSSPHKNKHFQIPFDLETVEVTSTPWTKILFYFILFYFVLLTPQEKFFVGVMRSVICFP